MRILLTGHHGYVGSVVGPSLAAAGHDVVGLDAFLYEGCDLFPGPRLAHELRRDIRDVSADDLAGFDAVVHLAALSNDPLGDLDAGLTKAINNVATVRLARAARQAGVERFVFASSCSMYGAADATRPVDESSPLAPLTDYARSKVEAETALLDLADERFAPTSLRFATAYGVSPRLRLDVVLNNLAGWALTTGGVRLLSDGSSWRPLVHVQDMAAAVIAVLGAPAATGRGRAFNVGAPDANFQIRSLAEIVAAAVPGAEVEVAPGAEADRRSYRVDFSAFASAYPAFSPLWDPERGAAELVRAYRDAGMTHDLFAGDRFVRLARLRALREAGVLDDALRRRNGGG
jgi:nucleoside-diphosphate-sugar epimerase